VIPRVEDGFVAFDSDAPLRDRLRVALPCGEIPPYSIYKGADVGVDTEKFTYFTLSVAWRRSIHEWMNFDGTPLPRWNLGTFGEQMRTFLSGESGFPPDTGVMIIVCSDAHSANFGPLQRPIQSAIASALNSSLAGFTSGHLWGINCRRTLVMSVLLHHTDAFCTEHCRNMTMEKLQILAAFPS
jgi:hypothetical protein